MSFYHVKSMTYLNTAHEGMVLAETHKTFISRAYLKRTIFSRTARNNLVRKVFRGAGALEW
jgi:hypothetical protein